MSDEIKKYLAVGFTAICLIIAGIVFYRTMLGGGSGSAGGNRKFALSCTNCGGFEISADEFREIMKKESQSMILAPVPTMAIPCPKCGQKTCYLAQKCRQCETFFMPRQANDQNYPDRCPKCGFSAIEDRQKK